VVNVLCRITDHTLATGHTRATSHSMTSGRCIAQWAVVIVPVGVLAVGVSGGCSTGHRPVGIVAIGVLAVTVLMVCAINGRTSVGGIVVFLSEECHDW